MKKLLIIFVVLVALVGCTRNRPSDRSPIHLNPNMDDQEKYNAQEQSRFFADGMTMRQPVEGTVARGELFEDVVYHTGKTSDGKLVKKSPVELTPELMARGQERYNIYCKPCHGQTGNGQGIVVKKGMLPPTPFTDPRLLTIEDGHIFDVITNGVRNMPPYKSIVSVDDRWAIIAYFRALQLSQYSDKKYVPQSMQ